MKKSILLSALISIISFISYGQKCEEKINPISNEKSIEYNNRENTISIVNNDKNFTTVTIMYSTNGQHTISYPKGGEFTVKLEDGNIITMHNTNEASPVTRAFASQYGAVVYTRYTLEYQITNEQLKQLGSSRVVYFRQNTADGNIMEGDIKKSNKYYKKLHKGFNCMAESLGLLTD